MAGRVKGCPALTEAMGELMKSAAAAGAGEAAKGALVESYERFLVQYGEAMTELARESVPEESAAAISRDLLAGAGICVPTTGDGCPAMPGLRVMLPDGSRLRIAKTTISRRAELASIELDDGRVLPAGRCNRLRAV